MTGGKKETMAEFFANDRDVNSQRQRIWAALEVPLSSAASELVSRDGFCGYVLAHPHTECLSQRCHQAQLDGCVLARVPSDLGF